MKKLFTIFIIIATFYSCQDYDDQFDALNDKIQSLSDEIKSLKDLSSDVSDLSADISNLAKSVADNKEFLLCLKFAIALSNAPSENACSSASLAVSSSAVNCTLVPFIL